MTEPVGSRDIPSHGHKQNEVITVREIVDFFWRSKFIIVGVTLAFAIFSVIWVTQLPDQYESELLVIPNEGLSESGISGLSGQFGGLASLAGLDVGANSSGNAQIGLEMLKSRAFIQSFITKHNLLPKLLAANGWDSSTNELSYNKDVYQPKNSEWVRTPPKGKSKIPTAWEGYSEFVKRLTIETDPKSGVTSIKFEFFDPITSVEVATSLIAEINQIMRETAITESQESIDYLTNEIEQTNIAELKSALYRLVEEQSKTLMLAKVRDEYTFKTISNAVIPEDKSSPKRAFLCVVITFFGGLLSMIFALTREALKA